MSIISKMTNRIQHLLLWKRRESVRKMFGRYFNKIIRLNPEFSVASDKTAEKKWADKWGVFGQKPNTKIYKFYKYYLGDNENILPNDIGRNFIEPVLTPEEYQPFYNDKNSFGIFLDKSMMPKTYIHAMNNLILDENYEAVGKDYIPKVLESLDKVVVKPTKEMGGKGVSIFTRKEGQLVDNEGNILTFEYLHKTYKTDYLIQECFTQSEFMGQFNPTSVNTLRIAVLRDVESGELSIIGAFIRIGGKGAVVDNISLGGSSVAIDVTNGKLGKFACDISRVKHSVYNDINFADNEFVIPNWDKVKAFVLDVARRMPHMSLFANDIALDVDNNPKLIEINTTEFSYTFYQVSGTPFFGKNTDKIIEYCLRENKRLNPFVTLKKN